MSKKSCRFHVPRHAGEGNAPALTLNPVTAAVLAVLGTGLSIPAFAGPPTANHIVADGRTRTEIRVNGGVTDIRTQTVSGADAFNSFSQFQEAAGNQVNLYLPDHTENLINLVTGGPAEINGILNSYQNGKIGGRVFFADSYGLVVGAQGVLNVGALSVSAPTQQFMQQLMDASGAIDGSAVSALLAGTAPLSSDGVISIQGEVHALDAVRLQAEKVDASGLVWVMGGDGTDALAGSAVNTQTVAQATALVNHGGTIEIVAAGDASVAGHLFADGGSNQSGGSITVLAGHDTAVAGTAELSAMGQGNNADGGRILVDSGHDTTVGDGARFVAKAGASGDGGQIEVSAIHKVAVGSATFDASASHGKAGLVLFDPDTLTISSMVLSPGTDVDDEADSSIEVTGTGGIDTTSASGPAGNITLDAPSIKIDTGGQLIADDGTHTPGDITLEATDEQTVGSGLASAESSITVAGTLKGGEIDIGADASGTASYSSLADTMKTVQDTLANMPSDWASKLSLATDSFLAGLLPIGVDIGAASASVDIQSGADIQAAGDLTIASATDTKAAMPALSTIGGTPLMAAAVYGEVYGQATTTVDSGATLSVGAGKTLTVQATNKDELEVSATVNSDAKSVDITAAMGYANIASSATIASGAVINAPNVVVLAHNTNSFGVDSSIAAPAGGKAGIAAAVSITNTSATAQENANLGTAAQPIDSLVVDASSTAELNKTGADTSVGGESAPAPTEVGTTGGEKLQDYLEDLLGKALTKADKNTDTQTGNGSNGSESKTSPFKLGSAISVADSSQNASATIGSNSQIYASKQVAVHSSVADEKVHSLAASEVTSSEEKNNAATLSVSAGISVGLYAHNAAASVGNDALVVSPEIGVGSSVEVPWDLNGLNQWDGLSTINKAIADLLKKNGYPIMTSYANAQSDTGDVGLAGAVNYLSMQNTSTAWVNDGAQLECDASVKCTPNPQAGWTTGPVQYGTDETTGDPLTDKFNWTAPIDIAAENSLQTLNDAGNFSLLELNGIGGEENSKSVGGGFDDVNYLNTTLAGVGANAVISTPALAVDADSSDTAITVTPTAGRGSGVSANVIMAMTNVKNVTHASVSNSAKVTADAADVSAHEGLNLWTVAGAISQGSSVGVGVGVAVNNLNTDTQAYIGDNTCDAPGSSSSCTPASTGGGVFKVDDLKVQALTDGQGGALAVSGAEAKSSDESGGGESGGGSGGSGESSGPSLGGTLGFINTIAEFLTNFPALKDISTQVGQTTASLNTLSKVVGKAHTTENKDSGKDTGKGGAGGSKEKPKFGIAVSGSGTANISQLTTNGYIAGVSVMKNSAESDVTVNGLNNTFLISASGAGALAAGKNNSSSFSGGVAGAVAFSLIQNKTTAAITDSTLDDIKDLDVQALSGGSEVDIGLGLAVNTSSGNSSFSAAGSFSLSGIQNQTQAKLSGDTITGSGNGDANVIAYDNTLIGAGGGSLSIGGKASLGLAVTLADIGNLPGTTPTTPYGEQASITAGKLSGFDTLNVEGLDSSRIADGAATGSGGGKTKLALDGAFVFNNVGVDTSGSIGGGAQISGISDALTVAGAGVDPNGTTPDGTAVSDFTSLLTADGSSLDASLIDFSGKALLGSSAPLGTAIYGVAGSVGIAKNTAALSFVLNNIGNSDTALVSDAVINVPGAVNIVGLDNAYILGLSAGLGVSTGSFAGVGSVSANLINDSVGATLGDTGATPATTTLTAGSLDINAANGANINALAGNVAISGNGAALGVAIGFNEIGDQTGATLSNATTTTGGATTVESHSDGGIESAAVAGAVGNDAAFSGSFSINDIGTDDLGLPNVPVTDTHATVGNSTVSAGTLKVSAFNSAKIQTLAGAVAAASDGAAADAAFTINNVSTGTLAEVGDSTLNATSATGVSALTSGEIDSLALGGAGSSDVAITGSFTVNLIADHTAADLSGVTQNESGNDTTVTGTDQASIKSLAGAVALAGTAAVGVAVAVNSIGDTANAYIDGGDLTARNVTVRALSQDQTPGSANIQTIAAGIGGGGDVGGAASVAVNLLTGGVNAYIDDGALVTAADNVGVLANSDQGVDVLAGSIGIGGSAVGVGVGAVVNYLDNGTSAYISGSSTQVTANAKDSNDTLTVSTGTLANPPNVNSVQSMSNYVTPDLSETTTQVRGVTVNASTQQYAATLGISLAVSGDIGSVALSVMGNANVIGGTTRAYVDSATVNSAQQLDVNANNHSYNANFDLGLAASGAGFGGAAAVSVNSFDHDTDAYLTKATVANTTAINVNAQATQDAVGLTTGLAAGAVGGAGTGIINIFNGDTSAYVDQDSVSGGSLAVNANSEDHANLLGGSGALGGAAVAGTFVLAVSENNTSAYVGDDNDDTTLNLTGALDVEADSTTDIKSLTISGSAAGGDAIAGMAVVNVVQNKTNAYLDRTQLNQKPNQSGAGAVTVKADESITLTPYTGAVAGGGVAGVGAAANVAILQSQVGATVTDSELNSSDAVQVQALSSKNIDPITVTAGVGASAGISGGVGLILFGSGSTGSGKTDVMGQLGGTLGGVNSLGSQDNVSDPSGSLNASQASQLQQDTGYILLGSGGTLPGSIDGTSALISNSKVTGNSVSMTATDTTTTKSITGALGVGGVGAGAAIGYTGLYDQVTALVDSSSILNTGSLTVSALEEDGSGPAAEVDTYEGSGGLVGLGVSAAVANVDNTVTAGAGGTLTGTGGLEVSAEDTSSLNTKGMGASVGGAAAGLVVTDAVKSSMVNANLGDPGGGNATVSGFDHVRVQAGDQGAVTAASTGGSGGFGVAVDGANAFATDNAQVQAGVGAGVNIVTGSGGVNIQASDQPDTSASALGISISGGYSLAESLAKATVSSQVTAFDDADITGAGGLSITASSTPDSYGDPTASTSSRGGGGGVLAGAAGAGALSEDTADVVASTGSGVLLPDGNVAITANNVSSQSSTATGIAAAGVFAVGAVYSESDADSTTAASLGDGAQGTPARVGNLTVSASGTDNDSADATAGSGGLVSGNGAAATTNDNSTVKATAGDAALDNSGSSIPLFAGTISVSAQHFDNYSASTNSVNAAVVGASGAGTTNNANVDVETDIGAADLVALGGTPDQANVVLSADNRFSGSGHTTAAGGGVLSGSAGSSSNNLTGNASVNIASNAMLAGGLVPLLDNQGNIISPGGISIVADSGLSASDLVTDDTGGAIAGAGTSSNLSAQLNNSVNVNSGATLFSSGDIGIGTYTQASASTEGDTHTWGAAGVGDGDATTSLNTQQQINLDSGSLIQAFGDVNLNAGEDPTGSLGTSLNATAIGESYVRGLIAIPTASATTNLTSDAYLNVAKDANVESGADVNLGATEGSLSGDADGTAHGYELFIIPVTTHHSHSHSSGAGVLTLNGNITAGIYHDQSILIGAPPGQQCQWSVAPDVCGVKGQQPLVTSVGNSGFNALKFVEDLQPRPPNKPSPVLTLLEQDVSSTANADGLGYDVVAAQTAVQNSKPLPGPEGVIYAAGGNINVNADQITGSSTGDLTAYGAPSISITNTTDDYLVVGNILIPQRKSGQIRFTGAASQGQAQAFGIGVHSVGADQPATVSIQNTYNACQQVCKGPAILLMGNIDNLGGSVSIANASGSLGQFGSINAQTITMDIPNGLLAVYLPGQFYATSEKPQQVWNPNGVWFIADDRRLGYTGNLETDAHQAYQAALVNGFFGTTTVYKASSPPSQPNAATDSSLNAAEIAVQAKYIDIESPVTIGHPTNWTVDISPEVQSWIALLPAGTQGLIPIPESFNGQPLVKLVEDGVPITDDSQPVKNIGNLYTAQYNTLTGQIVVPNINAAGGGFGLFDGGIINTNYRNTLDANAGITCTNTDTPQCGGITVNDGFGHVTVNNPTSLSVTIQDINTGYGTPGEVVFMDTNTTFADGTPLTTWYVDQEGKGVSIYTNRNGATTLAQAETGQLADLSKFVSWTPGLTSTSYTPQSGEAVQWTDVATVTGTACVTILSGSCISGSFLDESWKFTSPWHLQLNTGSGVLADGLSVVPGAPQSAAFTQTIRFKSVDVIGGSLVQTETDELQMLNSVKADNPIAVNFVGNPSGAIAINSAGSVALNGALTNPSGSTDIFSNGSITQASGAGIVSHDLLLIGNQGIGGTPIVNAGGTVTGFSSPLNAQMTGGQLDAFAGSQGIDLAFDSPVTVDYAVSRDGGGYGQVSISAQGDISAGNPSGPNIIGQSITLNSALGGVGAAGAPLVIEQHAVEQGGLSSGAVNVSALNDINLKGIGGNLAVGKIASTAGNVTVKVTNGALLDASGTTSAQTLSQSQLQGVWEALNLCQSCDQVANVKAKSVVPFQNLVDANYRLYWRLLDNGSVNGSGQFVLDSSAATLDAFEAQAKAAGVGSDAQAAQAYADGKYQGLVNFFNTVYKVCSGNTCTDNWQSQSQFQKFDDKFSYTATKEQATSLTANGTYQNTGQLIDALNASALRPAGGTPVGSSTPNVSGKTVTLSATQGIGSLGPSVLISYTALYNGTLDPDQVAALAAAVTPGDVSLVLNSKGTAIDHLSVTQTQPLFLQTPGPLTATSDSSVYLQANGNLNIAGVTGAGDVRLLANGSLLNAAAPGKAAITTIHNGNLTLVAGGGSLGAANAPLTLAVSGALLAASASADINLEQLSGDLTLDHVYAVGNLVLHAPSGSLLAFGSAGSHSALSQNSVLNLAGSSITLDAQGDIGSVNQALQLQAGDVGSTGLVNAQAGGSIYLASPVAPDGTNVLLQIGRLTAGGNIALTTGESQVADIAIPLPPNTVPPPPNTVPPPPNTVPPPPNTVPPPSSTVIKLPIPGVDLTADTLTAGGSITVNSGGSVTLGQANAQQNLLLQSAGDMLVTAADSAHGNLTLNSGGALALTNLQAPAGTLVANAFGDINLAGGGQIASDGGQAYSAVGSFTMGANSGLTAGGAVNIAATQNITLGAVTSSIALGQALNLTAGGAIAGNGDAQINLATAGGRTLLQAGTGIGYASEPLLVNLPWLEAGTTTGGIYIHDLQSLTAPNGLSAPAGDVDANIAGSFEFGNMTSGDGVTLTASSDLSGNEISAGTGGVNLNGGGDVTLTQVTTPGALSAQADGNLGLGNGGAGGDLALQATGNIAFQQLTAGGNLSGTAGGDVLGGSAKANGDLAFSGTDISLQDVDAGGNLTLKARDVLTADELQAGGTITVNGQDMQLDAISSGDALALNVAGNILFQKLQSSGPLNLTSTGGSIIGETLDAASADLSALGNIRIDSLNVLDSVNLAAGNISAGITQTGPGQTLQMYLDGVSGGQADNILVQVDAHAVTLHKLNAKQAQINTGAAQFNIQQGDIANWLYLITPQTHLWMNNQSLQLADVNVQLFQPGGQFTLSQDGTQTSTDSYVISYQVPYQVRVPNYDAAHVSLSPYYGGASLVRDAQLYMRGSAVPLDLSSFGTQIVGADGLMRQPHKSQPVVNTSPQGAVNTGVPTGNQR